MCPCPCATSFLLGLISFRLNKTQPRVLLFSFLAIRTLYILGHRICLDKTQTHHWPHRERGQEINTRSDHHHHHCHHPYLSLSFSWITTVSIDPTFSVVIVLIASEAEQNPLCNSPMGMLSLGSTSFHLQCGWHNQHQPCNPMKIVDTLMSTTTSSDVYDWHLKTK